jgi:hypothetical protein
VLPRRVRTRAQDRAVTDDEQRRCRAVNKRGKRCSNAADPRYGLCNLHALRHARGQPVTFTQTPTDFNMR